MTVAAAPGENGDNYQFSELFNGLFKEDNCHRPARFQHLLMKQSKAFCICPWISIYARTDAYRI
jgi:hypothetical protein